jgi:ABC-type Fe3+-hydroxamate transport system substrate-binding protein
LVIIDANEREVELENKPEKVVVLSGTLLAPYCAVDGEVIGINMKRKKLWITTREK